MNYKALEPNDLYVLRSTPQNKALSKQNKGHLGSRPAKSCITSEKKTVGRWNVHPLGMVF